MVIKNTKSLVAANYNFIKGQLGEAIVERLFTSLGMHICRYGYEILTPSVLLLKQQGNVSRAAIKRISNHPDFIVINPIDSDNPTGNSYKIEVKFSRNGKIKFDQLLHYDSDVIFLFLDTKNYWVASRDEISSLKERKKTKSFSLNNLCLLEDYKEFNFSHEQVEIIHVFKKFLHVTYAKLSLQKEVVKIVEDDFQKVWKKIETSQTKEQIDTP